MTRPHQPACATVSDDALFGPEAADYARYPARTTGIAQQITWGWGDA